MPLLTREGVTVWLSEDSREEPASVETRCRDALPVLACSALRADVLTLAAKAHSLPSAVSKSPFRIRLGWVPSSALIDTEVADAG